MEKKRVQFPKKEKKIFVPRGWLPVLTISDDLRLKQHCNESITQIRRCIYRSKKKNYSRSSTDQ